MSETLIFQFSFGLATDAPPAVRRVFEALARGGAPASVDLEAFRLGAFLHPNLLSAGRVMRGSLATIWETGIVNNPANSYHAPMPELGVRFAFPMHDDHYANGGYMLPFAVFDLVGEHGLFGTCCDETNRSDLTFYFREFDDLIIQTVAVPSMAYPLPVDAARNPEGYLTGWKPATAKGFKFGKFTRVGPKERAELIADADAMLGPDET